MPWKECHVMDERLRFVAPACDIYWDLVLILTTRAADCVRARSAVS